MSVHVNLKSADMFDTAQSALDNVGTHEAEFSPKVREMYRAVRVSVVAARNAALVAEKDVPRFLDDNEVYPKGRHARATKTLAEAQAKADALVTAQGAAIMATKLLEEEAMPRFEGTDAQRAERREEIKDILSRSTDPTATMTMLARDPLYAALVTSSDFGRSLLIGRVPDSEVEKTHELIRTETRLWVAQHGTDAQRKAALGVEHGEMLQGAVLAAAHGVREKLEPLTDRVNREGLRLSEDEARYVRERGRGVPRQATY